MIKKNQSSVNLMRRAMMKMLIIMLMRWYQRCFTNHTYKCDASSNDRWKDKLANRFKIHLNAVFLRGIASNEGKQFIVAIVDINVHDIHP
jgi:hypothetical protein